jgi:hypothetical protein
VGIVDDSFMLERRSVSRDSQFGEARAEPRQRRRSMIRQQITATPTILRFQRQRTVPSRFQFM